MTVTKHSGQPGNILAIDDRGLCEVVAMSAASTAVSISTGDSGKFFVIPAMASGVTVTLPAVGDGLRYEFYCAGAMASGTYKFSAAAAGTMVVYNDIAANTVTIGKTTGAGTIGGAVAFVSDGSLWYCTMEPAFTSAAPTSATMTEFAIIT